MKKIVGLSLYDVRAPVLRNGDPSLLGQEERLRQENAADGEVFAIVDRAASIAADPAPHVLERFDPVRNTERSPR